MQTAQTLADVATAYLRNAEARMTTTENVVVDLGAVVSAARYVLTPAIPRVPSR